MDKNPDPALYGKDLFGKPTTPTSRGVVSDKFVIPPFSVLSARDGFWQTRKKMWIAYGIEGEIGRDAKSYNTQGWVDRKGIKGNAIKQTGTSIFDPVLCELVYRWFCPPEGQIIDPFAGGSVRGIVAHMLGYRYWGCDLRQEQIDANLEQAKTICPEAPGLEWICNDALDALSEAPEADLIFTCPPYGNLEQYSKDPRDLSNMNYLDFIETLFGIIGLACKKLKKDRFACIVVSNFRGPKGFYRALVYEAIAAFECHGLHYYNEAILVTAAGSLPVRINSQFENSRKLGKTHQNILFFAKGDPKEATKAIKTNV